MSNLSFFEDEERKLRFIKRRAQAKFRQQFRHHGLELDGDDYEAVIANKFNFGIELKSQDQPVDGVEDQAGSLSSFCSCPLVVTLAAFHQQRKLTSSDIRPSSFVNLCRFGPRASSPSNMQRATSKRLGLRPHRRPCDLSWTIFHSRNVTLMQRGGAEAGSLIGSTSTHTTKAKVGWATIPPTKMLEFREAQAQLSLNRAV